MRYKRFGDNRGVALPLALMAFVVLGALSAALLSVGSSEVQIASNHLRGTQAFFLAEAGLEHAFNRVNVLWNTSRASLPTNVGSPQPVPGIPADTPLGGAGNYTVQYQAAGLWTWRVESTGKAIVGSQQFPQIRRAIMSTFFQAKNAIVANGDLTIGGSADVSATDGQCGNVHSNGNLKLTGSNVHIHGDATETSTFDDDTGNPQVDGVRLRNTPTETVPHIDPAAFLQDLKNNADVRGSLSLDHLYQVTVNADGKGEVRDGNGTLIETLNSGDTWMACGWKYTAGTPLAEWNLNSSTPCDGTYYFEGTVETQSAGTDADPWKTTLIATGDIKITGNPTIQADANYTVHDTLFYSGRDVDIFGTPSNGYNGLIAAHEQFNLHGNGGFNGFIIGESALNTPGSLVNSNTNTVSGNITLMYKCDSNPPLQGPLQVISWGL